MKGKNGRKRTIADKVEVLRRRDLDDARIKRAPKPVEEADLLVLRNQMLAHMDDLREYVARLERHVLDRVDSVSGLPLRMERCENYVRENLPPKRAPWWRKLWRPK